MARAKTTKLSPLQLARRVQTGELRRAKSREKLKEAACRLFAIHGADAPTIDDVIDEAGVARGTFYNHFKTREELFRAVADDIATDINSLILSVIAGIADPAERLAMAFRMFVRYAAEDEARGWILLRTMPLVGPLNLEMKNFIFAEFDEALRTGRFKGMNTPTATDIGLGLQIMTIHRLLVDRCALDHVEEAAEALLVALGVTSEEAHRLAYNPLPVTSIDAREALTRERKPIR